MPLTTYSTRTVTAPTTVAIIADAVRSALTAAGWGDPVDDFLVSSERHLVYLRYNVAGHVQGYSRIRIGTTFIRQNISDGWTSATRTSINESSSPSFGTVSTANATIHVLAGSSELSGIIWQQGTSTSAILWFQPETVPSWWNRALWLYAFVPQDQSLNNWYSSNFSPFGSFTSWSLQSNSSMLGAINRVTNRRDSVSSILLQCPSSEGIAGRSSPEMGQAALSGLARFDRLTDDSFSPARDHLVLNPASGGLIVRIA